ncbi:hypothetical protein BH10BAC5_BH10BAC5_26460 [soil metagenome]
MFKCVWSLQIVYGKQNDAVEILKGWGAEKMRSSHFKVSKQNALFSGFAGVSSSYIMDEYLFDSLADLEKGLADMSQPQFKKFSDALSPLVVPGSQCWTIYKMIS